MVQPLSIRTSIPRHSAVLTRPPATGRSRSTLASISDTLFRTMRVLGLLAVIVSAAAQPYKAPRTPDGKPDLQGIWEVRNPAANGNLEAHSASAGIRAGE